MNRPDLTDVPDSTAAPLPVRSLRRPVRLLLVSALAALAAPGCTDGEETPDEAATGAVETPDSGAAGEATSLPEGAQAISLLGDALYPPELPEETREEYEANLAEARAAVEADPDDVEALIWLGRRTAYLGRYREAIDIYTEAMELHPEDPRLYRHRGHRFISVRELDRAVEDLQRAVELVEGTEDRVEPDGLPNERGVPTSTLHFNIWYHLGLAHYLKGEMEEALLAWNECLGVSQHVDSVVATSYWLVNVSRRLGLEERAREVLDGIHGDMDIIEVGSYLDVLLLHEGERTEEEVMGPGGDEATLASTTTAYGVGNWHFVEGRREQAYRIWERTIEAQNQWAAFGYIAAESELARVEG